MEIYGWWDQVPEHLKTKTALAQAGLKPVGEPAARIEYGRGRRHRIYDLYDATATRPKQPATPAQLAALEAARAARWTCVCPECKEVVDSRYDIDPECHVCHSCVAAQEEGHHAAGTLGRRPAQGARERHARCQRSGICAAPRGTDASGLCSICHGLD